MAKTKFTQRIVLSFISTFAIAATSLICIVPRAAAAPTAARGKHIAETSAPVKVDRLQAKRLFIVGFSGQIVMTPSRTNEVIVRATKYFDSDEGAAPSLDILHQLVIKTVNSGDVVEVRAQLPPSASDWGRWASGKHVPSAKLEVLAPPNMSLEIYLTHGDVHVSHWAGPVTLTTQEGRDEILDVNGDVNAHTMFGSLKIENIKGAVSVENFSAALTADNISGKLKVRSFSGDTKIKKVTGPAAIFGQKATLSTGDTSGALEIQTGTGNVHVGNHKGSLVAHSESGAISAQILGAVDARLRSNSGALTLAVSRDSPAAVTLVSSKGNVNAPHNIEVKRSATSKVAHGDLGGGQGGSVRMSSESGDVTLKTL